MLNLTREQRTKCHKLGLRTDKEIEGYYLGNMTAFQDYLGYLELDAGLVPSGLTRTFLDWVAFMRPTLAVLRLSGSPLPSRPQVETTEAAAPRELFLKEILSPIRNQQNRGTCVSFATMAAVEAAFCRGKVDLSEQFQYWSIKQDDGMPDSDGSWVNVSFEKSLMARGACKETTWPYNPNPTNDPGQGPPPDGAIEEAAKNKPSHVKEIEVTIESLKAVLCNKKVVAFGVPVFDSWFRNPEVKRTGKINMPIPGEASIGGHAMALVGYKDDGNAPGGGVFILRNSWGTEWAGECSYGPGYGTIPYAYILKYGRDMWTVTK